MHHEKLIKAMKDKLWTDTEIKKATKILKELKQKESKKENLFNYWSNIFFLIVIILVTSVSLTPIITLFNEIQKITLIIIVGLIFGTLASHSIVCLEDYNEKHHRIWSNIILFVVLLTISYWAIKLALIATGGYANAFKYALIYKVSFAVFPGYLTVKHEIEINHILEKVRKKINKKNRK
jgi:hypothetical protein